jgi:SAM-dependent methyltransferase
VPRLDRKRLMTAGGHLAAPAIALAYRGDRIECPICGGHFRKLRPFGRVRRADALCPRCGSLERMRALWLFIASRPELTKAGSRVLHVAPDEGLRARLERLPGLDYVTGDLLRHDVDVRLDITAMPFEDGRFDLVVCSHVLEHVPDDRLAMREIARVLRPGGSAVLMVPLEPEREWTFEDPTVTDAKRREELFNQDDHVRIYGRDFDDRLREAGLEVERIDVAQALGRELTERHALVERPISGEPNPFRSDVYLTRRPA